MADRQERIEGRWSVVRLVEQMADRSLTLALGALVEQPRPQLFSFKDLSSQQASILPSLSRASIMLHFGDLPNEIIIEIFEHLGCSDQLATAAFRSLCLVSRRLNHLAEPFLYHTITLKVTSAAPSILISALLDRLERANLVRKLEIALNIPRRYGNPVVDMRFERRDHVLDRFRRAVDALELPECIASQWNDLFDTFDEQGAACAALAMAICPNLEELHFRYNGYGTDKHTEAWPLRLFTDQAISLETSNSLYKLCGNLRTLRFSRLDRRLGLGPVGDIRVLPHVPFFEIPSLVHFEISGAHEQYYTIARAGPVWDAFRSRHVYATLERFVLRRTELPFTLLESILFSCHSLKHFYYEMSASIYSDYHDRRVKFDYARLCKGLAQHTNSLESLCIDFFDLKAHSRYDFVDQSSPSFLALSGFQHLKTLRASVNALLPDMVQNLASRLPISLERLELFSIEGEDWISFLPLERFIQGDLAMFSNLRRVSVSSAEPDFMYWADIKMTLAEKDVSLIIE